MKIKSILSFILVFTSIIAFAKPYSIINSHFTQEGCRYWRVTVWDDNGTPHDPSDDLKVANATLNDCDDQPGTLGGSPNNDPIHTIVADHYTSLNNIGEECTFYLIRILDGSEQIIVEQTVLGGCD